MRLLPVLALSAAALCAAAELPSFDSTRAGPSLKELAPRVRHTFSGLQFVVLKPGQGPLPKAGATLTVKYVGWTANGQEFDASRGSGNFQFELGKGHVIKGWDEGLADMRKGERRYLIIPPELGYKDQPSGPLPPNSTLIFDVELVDF